MKNILKIIIIGLISFPNMIFANEIKLAENAKASIIVEASTGEILYENNINEKYAPASMTKMMSLLIIMEYIESGGMTLNEMVKVSENASSMGGSQIYLLTDEQMSVTDLLKGISIASANDATVALAERVAGTTDAFVTMMNDKARELNLKNTNFKNVHGLDESDHYSSAYDMALIAKELVNHQEILEFSSIYEDYLRENSDTKVWLVNTNKLVRFYKGADGLKTGYTKEAGYCLTATAKKDGMRIITVVMGEPDSSTRNTESMKLLDYAFEQYELETLLTKNSIIGKTKIEKAQKEEIEIVPENDVTILHKKGERKDNNTYKLELDDINIPLKKGDTVGNLLVYENNKMLRKVPVKVNNDVKKATVFELFLRYLNDVITGDINF